MNIMITGVGGGGVGEQILKCLRMSKLNYYLIGCDMSCTSKGLKHVDKGYIVPKATDIRYLECILGLCKKESIKVVFPGSEPELKILSRNRKLFEDIGIYIPLNSENLIEICMNKHKTMKFLASHGFFVEKYWEIKKEEDLEKVDIFPVIVKPSIGGGGSVNTFIAQNNMELFTFGRYLFQLYDQFLVQEYIGDVEHEYTVGILHDSKGKYINSIAVKKSILSGLSNKIKVPNTTNRKELGEVLAVSSGVSQGEIGRFKEVTEPSKKIAAALGATSAINIQCRIHNDKMYVFEINPRISGTSSLRALVGYNEPDLLIREKILGEEIMIDFEYQEGYIARGLDETFISKCFMKSLQYI